MSKLFFIFAFLTATSFAVDIYFISSHYSGDIVTAQSLENNDNECSTPQGECPGPGWFCLNGRCVQEHTGERCWNDVDCAIGAHCTDGVCR